MKTKTLITLAAATLLPLTAFTQTPPTPPVPPAPPAPAVAPQPPIPPRHDHDRDRDDRQPKVPVTFLGVETSGVPEVLCDQLGLPKGFGLVVDYVVPEGPAATAGVQQNDIIKMLNDQILTDPGQLSKLIRSFGDGTNVTLTVLRKGQEQKLTVKLAKKEMGGRRFGRAQGDGGHGLMGNDFHFDLGDLGNLKEQMKDLHADLGDMNKGAMHDAVMTAREEMIKAREQGRRAAEDGRRAADEARRSGRQINIVHTDNGGTKTTKIDINKAQIVLTDDKGEMRIDNTDGKKVLTAKDPQGKLLFSGPVESKEDIDKIPVEVRDRYNKLQRDDIPAMTSKAASNDDDGDDDDDDDDSDDNDDDNGATKVSFDQVSNAPARYPVWAMHAIMI